MGAEKVREGHVALALSPSPIIFVEYERRRYFNWFVVENERGLARRQSSASRFAPPVSEVDLICRISQGRSLASQDPPDPPSGRGSG